MLMRKYNELKEKRDNMLKEGYAVGDGTEADAAAAAAAAGIGTIMIVLIVVAIVMFALSIYAIVDAARNCKEQAMLHILLLIFVPAYLPVYFILRVTGNVCTLQ
tara:strand:+ start:102 stop:413 length:312 start_codon:yes stop_codon:yes gene_type:complete